MATIKEYIYEEILPSKLKLNRMSTKLGKIILQLYNAISKIDIDDKEEYDEMLSMLKKMRVEILGIEKRYYQHDISESKIKMYIASYIKGLTKAKKLFENLDDKKIKHAINKIEDIISDFKDIKELI